MAVIKNMMVRAGADFSAFTTQASKAAKSMRGMQSSISRSCAGIKTSVSGVKKVLSGLGVAVSVAAIVSAARSAAEAYDEQAENEMKLATVMRNTMKARNSEIQSVLDLCSAQQRLGIIGDEVQLSGAQELATYLTQTSTLKKLIPVMNDMVAQQYGFSASAENATNIATMLGKVMNGQVGALSRLGYSFTEAQEEILKYGNEEERAATLARVINQSVGGMNRALASTPTGRMKQLSNTLGDIKEKFGECVRLIGVLLLPLLWKVADVLERIANFANKAAVSLNKVFGSTSSLTGWQTVSTGVGEVTEDLDEAVTTAKELKRTLMGFDTLNILGGKDNEEDQTQTQTDDTSSSTGSMLGGLSEGLDTAQEGLPWLEKILTKLKDAKGLIAGVGAALGTWAIGSKILKAMGKTGALAKLQLAGLALGVGGITTGVINLVDAWKNGVTKSNMEGMIGGTTVAALGLSAAFKSLTAGGITAAVGGFAMLVTAARDWVKQGQLTNDSFKLMEGGILAMGAGLALAIPGIGGAIAGIVSLVAAGALAIYHNWDEIKAWLTQAYSDVSSWWESTVVPGIESVIDWIVNAFTSFGSWLAEIGTAIWEGISGWFTSAYDFISAWWEGVAVPAIGAAIDWIVQGFTDLGTTLGILWQETLNLATTIGGAIRDFFVSAVTLITTTAQNAAAMVKQHWEQLKAHTAATFAAIKTTVETAITTAKTAIVTAVTQAKTTAIAQWNAMLSSCKSIFTSLHSHITQTIQTATNYLASVSWYSLGVNLMQGFLNGLKSLMSTIWNEVVAFVQRCTEAVRNALGVHSPSKVFEEIGINVDRGALKGLRSGFPEILESAEEMANALPAAVSPAALETSRAYEGLSRNFPTADGDVAFSGEESMNGVLGLLEMLYDAVVAGRDTSITIGEEEVFNAVVRANNRAINRTGLSPLRG